MSRKPFGPDPRDVARVSVWSSIAITFVAIRNLELVDDADMSELAGIRSLELLGESEKIEVARRVAWLANHIFWSLSET